MPSAFTGVLIKVANVGGRVEITVNPWLREIIQGEEVKWTLDDPNALVAAWRIVDKAANTVGPPGKRIRSGLRGLAQAGAIWATQSVYLPSVDPPPGGGPPAVQDGDIESYSIEIDLVGGSNITLDPDYRVRP